ncbi:MAG: hypothetical protein EBT46_06835 [Actinobacteria bacterium]|nr:hypothetical protein [Actinomycetota bacterium]
MNFSTRIARGSDLATCQELEVEARHEAREVRGSQEFFATHPDAVMQPPRGTTVVAVADEHCIGFATLEFVPARQVGVGDALVAAARATAVEHGCAWLDALALPGDRAIKNLYERNGLTARLLIASTRL